MIMRSMPDKSVLHKFKLLNSCYSTSLLHLYYAEKLIFICYFFISGTSNNEYHNSFIMEFEIDISCTSMVELLFVPVTNSATVFECESWLAFQLFTVDYSCHV